MAPERERPIQIGLEVRRLSEQKTPLNPPTKSITRHRNKEKTPKGVAPHGHRAEYPSIAPIMKGTASVTDQPNPVTGMSRRYATIPTAVARMKLGIQNRHQI